MLREAAHTLKADAGLITAAAPIVTIAPGVESRW